MFPYTLYVSFNNLNTFYILVSEYIVLALPVSAAEKNTMIVYVFVV